MNEDQNIPSLNDAWDARATLSLEPELLRALSDVYGCHWFPLSLKHAGQALSAFHICRPGIDRIIFAPFNFQPVFRDQGPDIARAIVASARTRNRRTSARIKLHHPLPVALVDELQLQSAADGVETLVSLQGGLDGVTARMRPRHRSKFRSVMKGAEQAGISIQPFRDSKTLERFYRVMLAAYRDKHRMLPQPYALFDRLLGIRQGKRGVHGYVAVDNASGDIAGGVLILTDETQWCYGWGANDERYNHLEIGTLLIGHALREAISKGVAVLSLGMSSSSQDELRRYKRGWGGEEHEVITYYWRETPAPVDLQNDYALVKRAIAITPLAMLRAISPLAVKWLV